MILAVIACVFAYGLYQSQPWAHSSWNTLAAQRFLFVALCVALLSRFAHRYVFYALTLVLALSVGLQPLLGLALALLGAVNLGWLLFRQTDDRLNVLAGFALYVWIFSLTASLPIHSIWLWIALSAAPIAFARRFPAIPLPPLSFPVALPLVANFLLVLKPEVSADGLSQHLAIVQWVRDHGRFHFDAANQIWAVQPMAGDWALTIAGLVGNGEYGARLLNFVWLLLLVSFVYRSLRTRVAERPAALLTGIFASTPLLQLTSTSLFIENFWSVMITGALLAVSQGELMLAATLTGASGASKLLGLTPAPILALSALWRQPKWPRAIAAAALFIGIAIVPYARAYWATGNPVYHYANAFFKSPLMPSDVSFVDSRYPPRLTWHTPYDVTFHTDWFVESEPGTAGYQWLWMLPLSLFAWRRANAMERTALATAVFMVTLVFSRQASLRYVECAMPLLAIAFAPAAARLWEHRHWKHAATAAAVLIFVLNIYQMPGSSGYHREFALLPFNQAERDAYLTRSAPARKLIDDVNRLAPAAPVALLDGDEVAGLRGPAWTSTWHTQNFAGKLAVARSVADYVTLLREFHTEYIIAPREGHWRFLDESTLKLFLESSTDRLATSGDLQLARLRVNTNPIELPPAPPGTYDDSNARIIFTGPWYLDQSFAQPARRTITYSSEPAAALKFNFIGRRITYVFTRAFNRGQAAIEIDGIARKIVDLHSQQTQWQARVTFDGLGPGAHTIVIRNTSHAFIDVDEFVVE